MVLANYVDVTITLVNDIVHETSFFLERESKHAHFVNFVFCSFVVVFFTMNNKT